MPREISSVDPEMREVINELRAREAIIAARNKLSETSFREWLIARLQEIAFSLGYVIRNVVALANDIALRFRTGF